MTDPQLPSDVPPPPPPPPGPAVEVPAEPIADTPVADSVDFGPRESVLAVRAEVAKVIVGQDGVVSGLIGALLLGGHVLLEGVPGVAKTLVVKTLGAALDLDVNRIQFTPDLMPSDVVGQLVLDPNGEFRFRAGPIFTNLVIADEINRTPPKTQSALLEAMEERQVSSDGTTRPLPEPFVVIATQNPIEYEGTYPLPEAQLDRFLFKLDVGYPDVSQEVEILRRHDDGLNPHDVLAAGVRPVAGAADILAGRAAVAEMRVDDSVRQYIVEIVRATRVHGSVRLGVSPRGATALLKAAKAWAWLAGRSFVTPDEVKAVARPTLRHRLQLRPELELEGASADAVLDGILAATPVPR